jgi:hypothetical protein
MEKPNWDTRIQAIIKSVNRRGTILMTLGYLVYGCGGTAIFILVADKTLAGVMCMFFFQLLILYFTSKEMYPCIAGGFRAGLEANRDSVPLFEKIAKGVDDLEKNPESHPVVQVIGERIEKAISDKVSPVIDSWTRIGERLEKVLLPRIEETVKRLDAKVGSTTEGVKRVQQMVEMELMTGFLPEMREAFAAVKMMALPHAPPPPTRNFKGIIDSLSKPPVKPNGSAPVQAAPQIGGKPS